MNQAGAISLDPLYELASLEAPGEDVAKSALRGDSPAGRAFGKEARVLCEPIAESRGFYVWGFFDAKGSWHTQYVGKAGFGKASSLRARICEELRDERVFIWAKFRDAGWLLDTMRQLYGEKGQHKSSAGENHFRRALRKTGATHILWVSTPSLSDDEVKVIEPDLIELLTKYVGGSYKPEILGPDRPSLSI